MGSLLARDERGANSWRTRSQLVHPPSPSPPFFRIHRSYIVNLNRARELRARGERDSEIKLDPPVNKVLPVSRTAYSKLRKLLGI
ncbi:MAG: LytTR family transcriptional regulator DNA-binding domain-containing protein [Anaerolineales bacterium]